MRDQYRSKQELCDELANLRKQVADLKAEMVIRRRVEDALRHSEEQLRALGDSSPTGLCLLRADGMVRVANLPFARLLGYESVSELQRLSETLGLFAGPADLPGVLAMVQEGEHRKDVGFRRKDGSSRSLGVIGTRCREGNGVAIAVLEPAGEERSSISAGRSASP
ncbi:MAG TPA: PAS domain-containing protein [Gemmatimonadales bacterium]|jgi:PAS domain S-box-containing protein